MKKTNFQYSPKRRNFLASAAGICTLPIIGSLPTGAYAQAQAQTKHTFILPFDLIVEFVPELNADVGGHFRNHGLDIEITNSRGTSIALQQVLGQKASFTKLGGLDLIKAQAAQSTPLRSFGVIEQSGLFSIISLKSAPVRTPADMKGKTIGVASIGGGTENLLDLMLSAANIPSSEVPRQAIGLSPGNMAILKQGRIQAFFATLENVVALQRAGEEIEVVSVDSFAPLVGGAYVSTQAFLDSNPTIPTLFLRAIKDSVDEILNDDPNKILDRVEKKYELTGDRDRGYRVDALNAVKGLITSHGKENILRHIPDMWTQGVELVNKSGIARIADPSSLYTNKFVDELN